MLLKRNGRETHDLSNTAARHTASQFRRDGSGRRVQTSISRIFVYLSTSIMTIMALAALQPWRQRTLIQVTRVVREGAAAFDHGHVWGQHRQDHPPQQEYQGDLQRWLSFSVCNGLSNQRLAILGAVLLAEESGRDLVLPRLLPNGMQSSEDQVLESNAPSCDFDDIMDSKIFTSEMNKLGVKVVRPSPQIPPPSVQLDLTLGDTLGQLSKARSEPHVRISCPLLRVPPRLFSRHQELTWHALAAMQPSPPLAQAASHIEAHLVQGSPDKAFNVLHLRLESDWGRHCSQEGFVFKEECMRHTDTVGEQLKRLGVTPAMPLLLVLDRDNVEQERYKVALDSLESAGYRAVLMRDPPGVKLSREQAAMVSYHLAMRSHQFVGNAVSTFTALLIMERRHASKFAAHYNGGAIPLQYFVPLLQDEARLAEL